MLIWCSIIIIDILNYYNNNLNYSKDLTGIAQIFTMNFILLFNSVLKDGRDRSHCVRGGHGDDEEHRGRGHGA